MFGAFILITWVIGICFIANEILNAPEYDEYERPKDKRNG